MQRLKNKQCAWCDAQPINSHIVPQSVLRVGNELLGKQGLRGLSAPNLQVQDLPKQPLLCSKCDGSFSYAEGKFIDLLYRPLLTGADEFEYDNWLVTFATSIAWKRLYTCLDRVIEDDRMALQEANCRKALNHWAAYLRNKHSDIGPYQHHIFFSWLLREDQHYQSNPLIVHLLKESFDTTPLLTQSCFGLLTYFPGVVLFSTIDPYIFEEWDGTLIEEKGRFDGPQQIIGPSLQQYAVCSIEDSRLAATKVSDKQWKNIEKDILKGRNA